MDILLFGFKLGLGFALGWHLVAVPALAAVLLLERFTGRVLLRSLRRHREESVKVEQVLFDEIVESEDGTTLSGRDDESRYRYSRDEGYTWSDVHSFNMLPGDVAALWEDKDGH